MVIRKLYLYLKILLSKNIRSVYVYRDKVWKKISFYSLRENDIFRLYEYTGEVVKTKKGTEIFKADNNPYINKNGVYAVDITLNKYDS